MRLCVAFDIAFNISNKTFVKKLNIKILVMFLLRIPNNLNPPIFLNRFESNKYNSKEEM
jgi:hypothetical protein